MSLRRSTKLEILGKARAMSYKDLEKARTERTVKEAAKEVERVSTAGKGKLDLFWCGSTPTSM